MFEKAATKLLGKKAKLASLAVSAGYKLATNKSAMEQAKDNLKTLVRMVQSYAKGDYKKAPVKSLVMVIAAILYFVSPLDLIPDFILGIGFADDIAIIAYVYKQIVKDIQAFLQWEAQQNIQNIDPSLQTI